MATRYAVASGDWSSTSVWSATSGGSPGASVPGATDDVVFDSNSNGFNVVSNVAPQQCNNLTASGTCELVTASGTELTINGTADMRGYTGSWGSLSNQGIFFKGNVILDSGVKMSNVQLLMRGSGTLTSGGCTMKGIVINGTGITLTLVDNITNTISGISFGSNGGTLDAATHNVDVTTNALSTNNASSNIINYGSGTWNITGNANNALNLGAAAVVNAGTSLLKFSAALSADRTQNFGGHTFYNVENATTGGHALLINDSGNTFHNFTADAGSQTKILASSTQTATAWAFNGTSGSGCVLGSSSGGTPATIVQSSGTVIATYTTISDSTASGGALFIARNSTNGGGNTGWSFSLPAANQAYII